MKKDKDRQITFGEEIKDVKMGKNIELTSTSLSSNYYFLFTIRGMTND